MTKRGRPPYPDILTPREWEVLAMLREGLSNEEIAGRLDITERTARYHVSEILSKLGVSSRKEAAGWDPARRPWWMTGLAPVAFLWRRPSFGWLSPASAAVVGVVAATGLGLLAWGLVRTDAGGDDATALVASTPGPTATVPPPPGELVWESEEGDFRMVSDTQVSCGDSAAADRYMVPAALEIPNHDLTPWGARLLGLEAEPYQYVPAQVRLQGPYDVSPVGWEVNSRVVMMSRAHPNRMGTQELFLRRLDRPSLLLRYSAIFCNQEDGSPAEPEEEPSPTRTIEASSELPQIVVHRDGDYMSPQEAIGLAAKNRPHDVRTVRAELGTGMELVESLGLRPGGSTGWEDRVVWLVVLDTGDYWGPKRPGHSYGMYVRVDASTGEV